MSDCLHCDVKELIAEHLEKSPAPVNLAEIGAMIAQALGEFILAAPELQRANLLAESLATLSASMLEITEDDERPHKPH